MAQFQTTYGHLAVFLHDDCGGPVIAVVWKPAASQASLFRVRHAQDTVPADQSAGKTTVNVPAVLEGFRRLGQGILDRIEVHRTPEQPH